MQGADYGHGQEVAAIDGGDFLFPGKGSPYVPNPPLVAAPTPLPTVPHHAMRAPIYPQFEDIGVRPALIGFDFRKRQYIGV